MDIAGGCHCGNIGYRLRWPGDGAAIPARACDCTFCTKHGGVYTSHPQAQLEVWVDDAERVNHYAFGTGTAEVYVCKRCGVPPFVISRIGGRDRAVVNVNTFASVDGKTLNRVGADFSGEDVDGRLARREQNWIADVTVSVRSGDPA